jgi:hypothetical protein
MKSLYFFILILFLSVSAFTESYRFAETQGGKAKPDFVWNIKKTSYGVNLNATRIDRLITYWINSDGSNRLWKYALPLEDTDITAENFGSIINISGKLKGKSVKKSHQIDGIWMQSMTYSLNVIYKSEKQEMEFYTIRPDNLDLVKMKAVNAGIESIAVNGKNVDAYRVKVSLTGFLSGMWSASFWYRKSDLMFIRYDGKQGVTESSRSIINMKN